MRLAEDQVILIDLPIPVQIENGIPGAISPWRIERGLDG
jgi:hypothetical protein